MYKCISLLFVGTMMLTSCKNQAVTDQSNTKSTDAAAKSYGEKINPKGAISYDEMLTKMGSSDSLAAKVSGTVGAVCQAKGCWMEMVSTNPASPVMTVKFKDYGFFMPKDLKGKRVAMEGYAYTQVTSVDELRHYAEDAGKSKEEIAKITEPKKELQFMAHGVVILD
jgi:hypothetical protein